MWWKDIVKDVSLNYSISGIRVCQIFRFQDLALPSFIHWLAASLISQSAQAKLGQSQTTATRFNMFMRLLTLLHHDCLVLVQCFFQDKYLHAKCNIVNGCSFSLTGWDRFHYRVKNSKILTKKATLVAVLCVPSIVMSVHTQQQYSYCSCNTLSYQLWSLEKYFWSALLTLLHLG